MIFEITPWGKPVNWGPRVSYLLDVSPISIVLQLMVIGVGKNCFKLIMASFAFFLSLAQAKKNSAFFIVRV